MFVEKSFGPDLEISGRWLGGINNPDIAPEAAKAERKDANHEQYLVGDRDPHHCRCYKRQLHDAHEVRPQMGVGEHLARLVSFRARGSAFCDRPRDHPKSVDGLPLSDT